MSGAQEPCKQVIGQCVHGGYASRPPRTLSTQESDDDVLASAVACEAAASATSWGSSLNLVTVAKIPCQ